MSHYSLNGTCSDHIESYKKCSKEELDSDKCVKVKLDNHISAYINKTNLDTKIEPNHISDSLIQKVFLNYIIAKQILSNLSWQDKCLCQQVCRTWHAAMQSLKKEQLSPEDFVLDLKLHSFKASVKYKQSQKFYNEPLVVMTFTNEAGFCLTSQCQQIQPHPCSEPCNKEHACKF